MRLFSLYSHDEIQTMQRHGLFQYQAPLEAFHYLQMERRAESFSWGYFVAKKNQVPQTSTGRFIESATEPPPAQSPNRHRYDRHLHHLLSKIDLLCYDKHDIYVWSFAFTMFSHCSPRYSGSICIISSAQITVKRRVDHVLFTLDGIYECMAHQLVG